MQLNLSVLKLYKTPIILALMSGVPYAVFAYNLERTEYIKLTTLYTLLFVLFYYLIKTNKNNTDFLTVTAFIFRAVFILAIPNLSQDFYRFIWDGYLILTGFNPYLYTANDMMDLGLVTGLHNQIELYEGMGKLNASHFTNYPPINQFCFVLANLFPGQSISSSVIGLRLIIIAADFGTLFFGKKLLEQLNLPVHNIFWYVLNPFIIIELTGNLHFEGVMIFFLVWSLYLLQKGKWTWAAVVLALSISTKLIPLIFLPLFFQWFVKRPLNPFKVKLPVSNNEIASSPDSYRDTRNDKRNVISNDDEMLKPVQHDETTKQTPAFAGLTKLISFYAIVGGVTILLFTPFFSTEFISNYAETVGLWFQNFEFNASLYYIARAIGYTFRGYNEIAIIGKIIPLLVILFVILITFFRKNRSLQQLITAMLLVLSFYYFTATTVHPWYVATLLILSVFTNYKFPLVWSFMIILSYLAYIQIGNASKSENLIVIAIEYLIVYSVFFWEVFKKKPKQDYS